MILYLYSFNKSSSFEDKDLNFVLLWILVYS